MITAQGTASNGLPYVLVDGKVRVLAALPPTQADLAARKKMTRFTDAVHPVIPRKDWVEFDDDISDLPVLDQDGHGSCVGHGSVSAFQHSWNRSGYDASVRFSACWIYGLINGGQDNGAIVQDAIQVMVSKGVCLESTVPENMIYQRNFPAAAAAEAAHYRAQDYYLIDTPDEIGTAVQLRYAVSTGKNVYGNFDPDAQGVLPPPRGGVQGGHCMCAVGGMKQINGVWHVKEKNSWGTKWGAGGNCWVPLDAYYSDQNGHFVVVHPSQDNPDQPIPTPKP